MKPLISFGIMADCQYADADTSGGTVPGTHHENDNRYRDSPAKLAQAVETFNHHELAFVVHLGDFIDRQLDDADVLRASTDQLRAPLWHVLGNHDFSGNEGDETTVLAKYGLTSSYYSKQIAGYRFIVLDTNDLGVIKYRQDSKEWREGRAYLDEMKSRGAINVYEWNGGLGAIQLEWLERELSAAEASGQRAILFSHHPVFPPGCLNTLNDSEVLAVLDRHRNIAAYINGHNHVGAYGSRVGVPYLTVPGMLDGPLNAYGVVTVHEDKIVVDGYGRVQDMVFET